jgi:hypothetical protein
MEAIAGAAVSWALFSLRERVPRLAIEYPQRLYIHHVVAGANSFLKESGDRSGVTGAAESAFRRWNRQR